MALENGFELLVCKSELTEDDSVIYFCTIVDDDLSWIKPELLKKGKKFKVLM